MRDAVPFTTAQEFARKLLEQESKGKQKTQSPHHQDDVVSYNFDFNLGTPQYLHNYCLTGTNNREL